MSQKTQTPTHPEALGDMTHNLSALPLPAVLFSPVARMQAGFLRAFAQAFCHQRPPSHFLTWPTLLPLKPHFLRELSPDLGTHCVSTYRTQFIPVYLFTLCCHNRLCAL